MADNVFDQFHESEPVRAVTPNVFDRFHEPEQASPATTNASVAAPNVFDQFHAQPANFKLDMQSAPAVRPMQQSSGDFTPIGDAPPDFGEAKVQPGEMEVAGKEFRRLGGIGASAAASRALNLGAMLQQGMNPGETIAAKLTGMPEEYTTAGQARVMAKGMAPHVAADDRGGRFAEMLGGLAPDLAAAALTGGMAELPAGAGLGARALHGAMSMALPAAENTREAYNAATANGLTPAQAAAQAAVAGGGTLAMGAVPANIPGDLATRALSGGVIAGLQTEAQRQLANMLLPEDRRDLQQPFDAFNLGAGVLTGGVLAGALGHRATADNARGEQSDVAPDSKIIRPRIENDPLEASVPEAEAGPISNPTPDVPTTSFVADSDGNLREVPRQPEQPATRAEAAFPVEPDARQPPSVRYRDATPGSLADAANAIDQHADAPIAHAEAPPANVFDQFHEPAASQHVSPEEGTFEGQRFPDAEPGSLSHAANAVEERTPAPARDANVFDQFDLINPAHDETPGASEHASGLMNPFDAFDAPEMARVQDESPAFRIEPVGPKGLMVHGDAQAARDALAAGGFEKRGRIQNGALRFDAADREAIENALLPAKNGGDARPIADDELPEWVNVDPRKNPEFFDIRQPEYGNVLDTIAKAGGLNRDAFESAYGVDPANWNTRGAQRTNQRAFGNPLFRKEGGMRPDDLREFLQQENWLPRDGNGPPQLGAHDAFDLVDRAMRGENVLHPFEDGDFEANARHVEDAQREYLDDMQARRQGFRDAAEMRSAQYADQPAFSRARGADTGDLFGGATDRDRVDAAVRAKLDELRGGGRAVPMHEGAGDLFAGARPEQARIPDRVTDSPEFRRYFEGSQVVDRNGEPLVLHHGTADDFNVFRDDKLGLNTGHMTAPLGHFLTESRPEAQRYAENAAQGVPADERVISAYASIKNPARMTKDQFLAIDSQDEARALRQTLERQGHDGIRLDLGSGKRQWIAFDSGQIKDVNNRGTFDRNNPDIRYARNAVDESGTPLTKEEVSAHASRIVGAVTGESVDADRRVPISVVDSFEKLPDTPRQMAQAQGVRNGDIKALHVGGRSYLLADQMRTPADVQEAIFHEHYTHGGLRAKYGAELGPKLDELLRGVGGVDGVRRLAERQGIDLSGYEKALAENPKISRPNQQRVLMEELLAHMSKLTGTLRRTVQEWAGAVRDWLRRNGFAKLAEYGETDLAHVLRQARQAATERTATNKSPPFYQRTPGTKEPAGIPGESVAADRSSSQPAAGSSDSVANPQRARWNDERSAESRPADVPPRRPGEAQNAYARRISGENTTEVRAATALKAQQKIVGRHAIREMLAKRQRSLDVADAVFGEYRKAFDKTDPAKNFANIDDFETGKTVRDPEFRAFLTQMKAGFNERVRRLRELDPKALQHLITHYMPHVYKDPAKAAQLFKANVDAQAARHSIAGGKEFLEPRSWPTLKQAMESGLQPITNNPADWVMLRYASMDKLIGSFELRSELGARGWLSKVKSDEELPFGYKRVADPAFNGYAVPEQFARDITNYLDPGFSKYAAWRTLRGMQNFMVAADLGFSGFHATFTSTDNVVMHLDIAARRAAIGDSRGAAATLVKALTSVVTSPFEGHRLNQQWRGMRAADANTSAILDALERGGARWKMSTTDYQNAIPKLARMFRQMQGAGIAAHAKGKTPTQIAVGTLRVPVTALQAAAEMGSYLIHHVLVPNQKMAARVLLYKYELDRRAQQLGHARGDYAGILDAMHPDVVRQLAAQVNDVVDFRLGQMAYDNRFWPRIAQDIAQATVMAPGWQYGMIQTVAGAAKAVKDIVSPGRFVAPLDKAGNITDAHMGRIGSNLSYFTTLALTLGGGMALLQYLLTGQTPDGLKDYFFPRTGRKNDDDWDERLQFPNFWSDHWKLATEPVQTIEHKIHPFWKVVAELGRNRDYFGTQIHDPNAPTLEQARQVGEYIASKFVPITVGNINKGMRQNEGATQQAGHFFGINDAPARVARSDFQNFVAQGGTKGWGEYTKTPEDAQRRQAVHAASAAIRRGEQPDFGNLAPQDRVQARKDAQHPVPAIMFKHLSDVDKVRAYELATPQERERYGLRGAIGRMNLERSAPFKRLPADQQAQMRQRLQTIRSNSP